MIEAAPHEKRVNYTEHDMYLKNMNDDSLVEKMDGSEFLGYDMCKEKAINWGKGKSPAVYR